MCPTTSGSEETIESIDEAESNETDEDVSAETEDVSTETIAKTYSEVSSEVSAAREQIRQESDSIKLRADKAIEVDILDSTYHLDDISDKGPDTSEIRDQRRRASEYRENEVGTQNRKGRLFCRAKGIALLLGLTAAGSALGSLVVAIIRAVKDEPAEDSGLTEEQKELLISQVRRWQNLPERAVWEMMASYVDSWNPSWQAQLLMMDTIKTLAKPLSEDWVWRNNDAAAKSTRLVDAYAANTQPPAGTNRARVLYDTVKTMTYDLDADGTQVELPRQIAADLVELAITDIVTRTGS